MQFHHPTLEPYLPSLPSPPLPLEKWNNPFMHWKKRYVSSKKKNTFTLLWRQIPKFVCWEIWLARNQAIFHEKLPPIHNIFFKLCGLISKVFRVKSVGFDPRGTFEPCEEDSIIHIRGSLNATFVSPRHAPKQQDWKLRLDNNKFSHWQRQQHSFFLFFDGETTGTPRVAGAGGVIFDSEEKQIVDYSSSLGQITYNKAEIITVYMGLNLAHEMSIQTLTVLGDYEIVIKELMGRPGSQKCPLKGTNLAINSLKKKFTSLSFFHILQNQNSQEDNLVKVAKYLEQSHLLINQTPSYVWLP